MGNTAVSVYIVLTSNFLNSTRSFLCIREMFFIVVIFITV
jgi:hypothetical protein